eukprot:TRINITY_DN5768_c0_g1_i1.p1 TRINITY_DN5768_c0_g1~~TRINITY_DN5768_c0_g1_i1.p1  ORF type:complete len:604 (+),score=167.72 TRINITY_DN5768_c0_g1_i1:59-1813(+)
MSRRSRILTGVKRKGGRGGASSPEFSRLQNSGDPFEERDGEEVYEEYERGDDALAGLPRMSEEQVHLYKEMNRFRRKKDLELRHRNLILLFTVFGSIALIILYFWIDFPKANNYHFAITPLGTLISVFLSCLSIIQILIILEYYFQLTKTETDRQRSTLHPFKSSSPSSSSSSSFSRFLTFIKLFFFTEEVSLHLKWQLFLEIFIFAIHPLPFLHQQDFIWINKILALLVFCRLYILAKVYRDYSAIYSRRHYILSVIRFSSNGMYPRLGFGGNFGRESPSSKFDTFFALKILFYTHPIVLTSFCIGCCVMVFAYGIYVFEREIQHPAMFTYSASLYVAFSAMATGWASDHFSVYVCQTVGGQFSALCSTVAGLLLFAVLVDYLHTAMRPTRLQENALHWLLASELEEKRREESARLIQILWRWYRERKRFKATAGTINEGGGGLGLGLGGRESKDKEREEGIETGGKSSEEYQFERLTGSRGGGGMRDMKQRETDYRRQVKKLRQIRSEIYEKEGSSEWTSWRNERKGGGVVSGGKMKSVVKEAVWEVEEEGRREMEERLVERMSKMLEESNEKLIAKLRGGN